MAPYVGAPEIKARRLVLTVEYHGQIGNSGLIRNDADIIDLTLDLREKVLVGLFSGGACLALGWALVQYLNWGIPGICVGFILGRSILTLAYPAIIGRFLGLSMRSQMRASIRPIATTATLFAAGVGAARSLPTISLADTWPGLVLSTGTTFLVAGLAAYGVGLTQPQRAAVLRRGSFLVKPSNGK